MLAFIGAAVSLSRRIPEYQRRSEGDYKATEVGGPTTLAGAVGLAFITGFLSEHVLLMIRGMAEGIRPATTRTTQPPVSRDPP